MRSLRQFAANEPILTFAFLCLIVTAAMATYMWRVPVTGPSHVDKAVATRICLDMKAGPASDELSRHEMSGDYRYYQCGNSGMEVPAFQ